jgi:hypothetical protein
VSTDYIPGTCNIGKGEIRRRQFVALIGLFLTITVGIGLLSNEDPNPPRFFIFLPALVFAIGFVQSRKKFCLAYGFAGTFNFGKLGTLSRVASAEDRKADRKMAISIFRQSALLALAITIVYTTLAYIFI